MPALFFKRTPQIAFSASLSCAKTPDAPRTSVPKADDGREHALRFVARRLNDRLDFRGGLWPDQPFDLLEDFTARCLLAKEKAGGRDRDDDQRRHGKNRVVGERRAKAQGAIFRPIVVGCDQQGPP